MKIIQHRTDLEHGFCSCMEMVVLEMGVECTGSFTNENVCK